MRFLLAILGLGLALALAACGGEEATSSEPQDPRFGTVTFVGKFDKPHIQPPTRPLPKRVLVRDLKVGSGPVARRGDWIGVHYIGANYKTGEEQYHRWSPLSPLELRLGFGGDGDGWEEGIEGMRAGGIREMIVPSRLLYRTGTIDYVVELVKVKPAPEKAGKG